MAINDSPPPRDKKENKPSSEIIEALLSAGNWAYLLALLMLFFSFFVIFLTAKILTITKSMVIFYSLPVFIAACIMVWVLWRNFSCLRRYSKESEKLDENPSFEVVEKYFAQYNAFLRHFFALMFFPLIFIFIFLLYMKGF